jgi:hypothetical protein
LAQRRWHIVNAEPRHRVIKLHLAVADSDAHQCAQQAFAGRIEQKIYVGLSPGRHDRALLHHNDGGGPKPA